MNKEEPIKRLLAAYAPPADPAARQRTIQALRTLPPRRRLSGWRFLLAQAGFIHKRMWALQLAFLAGIILLVQRDPHTAVHSAQLYWQVSAAMPLLILINVTDLVRIYNGGMVELELVTRFSLPRVTAARLLIFGLTDGVLLLAAAGFAAAAARTGLLLMLVYCLVPFDLMCLGCLILLHHVKPDRFTPAAVMLAAVLAALSAAGGNTVYQWLDFRLWAGAALALTLALPWQLKRSLRDLQPGRRRLAAACP